MSSVEETIRLYDKDAYGTKFEARVLSCQESVRGEETVYQVVLDQTLFFPEEGGQSPDQGTLGDAVVMDVQIRNNVITHIVDRPLTVGNVVSGEINWQHRFSNMQQHSGEHIFSGIVHRKYGYNNVGFHLSDQIVTMDFDGVLTAEQVEEIETEVNQGIIENVEVIASFPRKEELAQLAYRSKIEIDGQVRIVTIPGYDICACCAPHVRRTGEIGMLKVMSLQNYKGGVRISILCGFRALQAFSEKSAILTELGNMYTCGQDMLVENIGKQKAMNQTLKGNLVNAKQQLMEMKLEVIPEGQRDVLMFEKDVDANVLRNAVNKLVKTHEGIVGMFTGDDSCGYSYVIGSSHVDCKELAQKMKDALGARGGGSSAMIQGSVAVPRAEIEKLLTE